MSRVPTPKQRLRAAMKRTVESVPTRERALASARVHELLLALPEWTDASIVLLYHAMPDEVDTHETILAALASQKRVYLPRVAAGKMGFHRLVDELSLARLARHPYGMLEPDGSATPWDAGEAHRTLVVCPGRAFDLAGNRLGRGGAFYDRFLRELRRGPAEAGRRPDTPADPLALAATPGSRTAPRHRHLLRPPDRRRRAGHRRRRAGRRRCYRPTRRARLIESGIANE